MLVGKREDQHLQPDQHKQDGVQDFVNQLPERIQMLARRVRHGVCASVIAHHQPCHDHGDGAGEVPRTRHRIAPRDNRQRDHDLDLILVDTAQQRTGQRPQPQAKEDAAHGFLCKQPQDMAHGERVRAGRQFRQDDKHHDPHAIIKERFARNFHFQALGSVSMFQDAQYRNGVGW